MPSLRPAPRPALSLRELLASAALAVSALLAGCSMAGATPMVAASPAPAQADSALRLDVLSVLEQTPRFSTFARILVAAGLEDALRRDGQWTVVAPTDEAFQRLPRGTVDSLLAPESREALVALAKNHLVEGLITSDEMRKRSFLESIQGGRLAVRWEAGLLKVEGGALESVDLEARNGVVHAIGTVLMPQSRPE